MSQSGEILHTLHCIQGYPSNHMVGQVIPIIMCIHCCWRVKKNEIYLGFMSSSLIHRGCLQVYIRSCLKTFSSLILRKPKLFEFLLSPRGGKERGKDHKARSGPFWVALLVLYHNNIPYHNVIVIYLPHCHNGLLTVELLNK